MVQNNTASKVTIVASSASNSYISYGTLISNSNIGYINSKTFEPVNESDNEFNNYKAAVDAALTTLQSKTRIIIDVRTNGGGQSGYAYYLAGRFASTTDIEVSRVRIKTATGSTVTSLGDWITSAFSGFPDARSEGGTIASADTQNNIFKKSGSFQYTNKVAVLTSGGTASSGEFFTAVIKSQSHVKTIGDKTFGIFAGSENVTLTNGSGKWKTRISVQDTEVKINGTFQSFEGIGITPDELSIPTAAQVSDGKDTHIEAAINYIN